MKHLGDQWIEVINGQEHMVKCVGIRNPVITDGNNFITKDLGILNDDGCLPAPWNKNLYPNIDEHDLNIYQNGSPIHYFLIYGDDGLIKMWVKGKTKQEAIDAWNRRV